MRRVKLSTNFPDIPVLAQTPGGAGEWGDVRFELNRTVPECDLWVVYEGLLGPETAACPPGATVLITGEPADVKRYPAGYLDQFAHVVSCQDGIRHPGLIRTQQALPWHVCRTGKLTYDRLKADPPPPKDRLISVVCSAKARTEGHRRRLRFLEALGERLGARLDVFGRGIREIEEKWDALAPYRFHLVMENTIHPDYWTEKLADAFLAGCYPFYSGCPNIGDYFEPDALTPIDIDDVEGAIGEIERGIREGRDEAARAAVLKARKEVLDRHNLFPFLCDLLERIGPSGPKAAVTLMPESTFRAARGKGGMIRRLLRRAVGG